MTRDGLLHPYFVGVRDGLSCGNDLVRAGYQRVLEARFNDAAFFVGRDCGSTLESKLPFSSGSPIKRRSAPCPGRRPACRRSRPGSASVCARRRLSTKHAVSRAAKLVYADLVTDVVKEFPELRDTWAASTRARTARTRRSRSPSSSSIIRSPRSPPCRRPPRRASSRSLAKLDSLAGCFAAGMIPTGSADPYALRRQALGIVRIALEKQMPLDLDAAIAQALSLQPVAAAQPEKLAAQLSDFVWGRAQSLFEDMEYAVDEVRSVRVGALKNFPDAFRRLSPPSGRSARSGLRLSRPRSSARPTS